MEFTGSVYTLCIYEATNSIHLRLKHFKQKKDICLSNKGLFSALACTAMAAVYFKLFLPLPLQKLTFQTDMAVQNRSNKRALGKETSEYAPGQNKFQNQEKLKEGRK